MHFLPDVYIPCEQCKGRRYNRETLEILWKGHSIADVLEMSVEEALHVLREPARDRSGAADAVRRRPRLHQARAAGADAVRRRGAAGEAGAANSASGRPGGRFYILDEPTTGLHFEDVRKLLGVLQRLVDAGNTIVVIEHNLDVVKSADWVIDLGPEGGDEGGLVVAKAPRRTLRSSQIRTPASSSGTNWPNRCAADPNVSDGG